MGQVLDTYNRYRELLFKGDFAHLTDVVDEDFVETCVGLTGWTRGLDIAAANFAAGIGAAFSDLTTQEYDHIEAGDTLAIRGRGEGTHTGRFLGLDHGDGRCRRTHPMQLVEVDRPTAAVAANRRAGALRWAGQRRIDGCARGPMRVTLDRAGDVATVIAANVTTDSHRPSLGRA